jgi:hypothetical protein
MFDYQRRYVTICLPNQIHYMYIIYHIDMVEIYQIFDICINDISHH